VGHIPVPRNPAFNTETIPTRSPNFAMDPYRSCALSGMTAFVRGSTEPEWK